MQFRTKQRLKKLGIVGAVCIAIMLVFMFSGDVENYQDKYKDTDFGAQIAGIGKDNTYAQYLERHGDAKDANIDLQIDLLEYETIEGKMPSLEKDGIFTYTGSIIEWHIDVPEAGYYTISMEYTTAPSRGVDMERALYINGEVPFEGANSILFTRLWTDAGPIRKDNQGNDIRPSQTEVFEKQQSYFKDAKGYIAEAYRFYFGQGENTIALSALDEPMIIHAVTLCAPSDNVDYAAYMEQQSHQGSEAGNDYLEIVQGESAALRSSPSLYARYDRSSPATVPYSIQTTVLNYIGGDPWNQAGEWIQWEFSVPQDGFYHITLKGRQNYSRGSISCRSLYIDGQIPFREMESVSFYYENTWNTYTLSDNEGNYYQFYLTAGSHTLRLEVTLGDMGLILQSMEESVFRLNQIYRKILVLTGVNPDQYRDYGIATIYPDAIEAMDYESKVLFKLVDDTVAVTGQKSDRIAVAQTLAIQLEEFVKDPDKITQSFTAFKDNITSLGTAMQTMTESKLDIDLIMISSTNATIPKSNDSFFARAFHEICSCFVSYTVDYDALGDVYDNHLQDDTIEVWILTGRDQSTILKTMVDDDFTPNTGIRVNVKLVKPEALLNAVVAGNGPDVVVSTDSWNPVNYALRNAVVDLTQFDGFEETISDFYPSAYTSFEFEGGIYALPETQICSVLFYREDILDEYGLSVPQTWEELIAMLPTIQGNNMSVGIPFPDIANPNLSAYYAMLYQNGGSLYNLEATKTLIGSEAGVSAFETYTSLYNDYGLPIVFDFVSRFRSGEMPIGISDYTVYNTLAVSAPEIRGLWNFTMLPGTWRTDENDKAYLDRSIHSQGTCTMMIATDDEKVKRNAWQFMQWWVSEDAQVRFGREIESVLGASARYATANKYAFEQLAWSAQQVEVIRTQMEWAIGYREVAGGYYTNRHITNAMRKVINDKTDQRETLLNYARTIDEEIIKKRSEFGLLLK